jgi:hypothetical protein
MKGVIIVAMLTAMKPFSASKRIRKVNGLISAMLKAKRVIAAAKAIMTAKKAICFRKTMT